MLQCPTGFPIPLTPTLSPAGRGSLRSQLPVNLAAHRISVYSCLVQLHRKSFLHSGHRDAHSAACWRAPGTTPAEMKTIQTTVYRLPCAGFAEKDGTFTNTQRLLQWRFIDEIAGKLNEEAIRAAQAEKDAMAAYRAVFEALGMSPETARLALGPRATAQRS